MKKRIKKEKEESKIPLIMNKEFFNKLLDDEHHTFIEHISERINFLKIITSTAPKDAFKIDFAFLEFIWNELVENSFFSSEKDICYRWIRELAENMIVNIDETQQFFTNKMIINTNNLTELSLDGFNCFKSLFLQINKKEENFLKLVIRIIKFNNKNKILLRKKHYYLMNIKVQIMIKKNMNII